MSSSDDSSDDDVPLGVLVKRSEPAAPHPAKKAKKEKASPAPAARKAAPKAKARTTNACAPV